LHSIWLSGAYPLAVEVVVVVPLEDFLDSLLVVEDDEAEAARAHRLVVVDDVGFHHLAELLEVALERLVVDGQRQASDEDLPTLLSVKFVVSLLSRKILLHVDLAPHDPVLVDEDGALDGLAEGDDGESLRLV
jgi:hypothetical protein